MKRIFSLIMVCLLCLSMFTIFAPKASASDSLVGYWKFDEGSGSIAHDSAGTNDGVIRGVPSWTTGIVGGALRFDGAQNNYVALSSQLGVTDAMTGEAWVYPEFDPTNPAVYPPGDCGRQIIRKSSCGDDTFFLAFYSGYYFNSTNPVPYIQVSFYYQGGEGVGLVVSIPGLISEGQWYHLVTVFKRNDYARLYVNGVEKTSNPTEDKPLRVSSRRLTMGQEADIVGGDPLDTPSDPQTWIGKIDEAKIYNCARTAEEILSDYNSVGGGLVGYWKFDEGSGTTAADSSGNGNTGTLVNSPQWVAGISGMALSFDGSDDYVLIPDSSSLDIGGNQISFEFWMNSAVDLPHPTTPEEATYFFDKGDAYVGSIQMDIENPTYYGRLTFSLPFSTPDNKYIRSTQDSWSANTWYHIALTYDGSVMRIYVNGVLDNAVEAGGNVNTSGFPLAIGSYCEGTYNFFEGVLDEFAIYDYARTSEQIQSEYVLVTHDWPMFHHDFSRSGYSTSDAPNTNRTMWNYTTGGGIASSPAVMDGRVYVGSFDHNVYCLDAYTGAHVWNYTAQDDVAFSSPAIAEGRVCVGSQDKNIYCLNASDGALLWTCGTGGYVESSPIVADGKVFIGSNDNKVYSLNASTGELIWNYTTGDRVVCSPAVAGAEIYVLSGDNKVYCLDQSTGTKIWDYATADSTPSESSPAISNGMVYVGSDSGNVYCLNASTGSSIWIKDVGSSVEASPAIAQGVLYIGEKSTGKIFCLNASTGEYLWNCTIDGTDIDCSAAVADGKVYFGSSDHRFYCLNATTGAYLWTYNTGGDVDSSPAIAHGIVYVGSLDGNVYAFGPVHDVAVTNVVPCKTIVSQGYCINMTVTVEDMGESPETFNVKVFANTTSFGSQDVTLPNGDPATIMFSWNTIGVAYGNYTITAYAHPVLEETNTANNNFTDGLVKVTIPGDVTGDFKVSMDDIVAVLDAFGSKLGPDGNYWHKPPGILDPFSPNMDIDSNMQIDMGDVVIALDHFGQHYP